MTQLVEPAPVRLGLPKGRVLPDTLRGCEALGIEVRAGVLHYPVTVAGRAVTVHLLKIHDIARLLASAHLDLGVTGDEWLMESAVPAHQRWMETGSYHARLCLLMAGAHQRALTEVRLVASPYPVLASRLLRDVAPQAVVIPVAGSTEALVPDVVDAALDVVESGASAVANGLVICAEFGSVTTHLVRSSRCSAEVAMDVGAVLLPGAVTR